MDNGYLLSLLLLSAASGLIGGMLGENKTGRYVKFAVSLSVLVLLASPLTGLLTAIPDALGSLSGALEQSEQDIPGEWLDSMRQSSAAAVCSALEEEIFNRWGVHASLTLTLDDNPEQLSVSEARVTLRTADSVYEKQIGRLLSQCLDCGVTWEYRD